MKALILSGGSGTRLRPLTYSNAKQLIPLANKPILFYLIEKVVRAGIKDIGIIVGDTREQVESALGNGEKWGVNLTFMYQQKPLGLAHAVKTASAFLKDDSFVMLLGDNLFQMELDELINDFYSNRSNASILLHRVDNPSQFGVAVVKNEHIVKLVEKPDTYISDLIITGVYVFDKTIFKAIDSIKPSGRGELEITDAMQELLDRGGIISFKVTKGWWKDTGKLADVLETNRLIMDEMNGKVLKGKNTAVNNSIIDGPAVIGDSSTIFNSTIGPYTSIGSNVLIENCNISNSIILDGAIIKNVKDNLTDSLIGKYCVIEHKSSSTHSSALFVGDECQIRI